MNPIKLYEENKVIAGFSLLNLLFKQGRSGLIRGVVEKLIGLYNQKKIKPVVDSLWALEEVSKKPSWFISRTWGVHDNLLQKLFFSRFVLNESPKVGGPNLLTSKCHLVTYQVHTQGVCN